MNIAKTVFVVLVGTSFLAGCATQQPNANEEVVVEKVPILGDIPLLGMAFRRTLIRPKNPSATVTNQPIANPENTTSWTNPSKKAY